MCIWKWERDGCQEESENNSCWNVRHPLLQKRPHLWWERCSGQQCSHTFTSQTSQDPVCPWIKILKSQRLWNTSTDVLVQTRDLGSCFHFVKQALITKYKAINFHMVFCYDLLHSTSCCSGSNHSWRMTPNWSHMTLFIDSLVIPILCKMLSYSKSLWAYSVGIMGIYISLPYYIPHHLCLREVLGVRKSGSVILKG